MSFITVNRHWDVLVFDATHKLKHDTKAKTELSVEKTLEKGTLVHLRGSRKKGDAWECLVLTPKVGKRGYVLKSGYQIWFVDAEALERI